ncbi:MAG TPA: tetratricopeptide repeat protein [Vicinamibacterales bacterium]|nr:tetratricopeptide repeat protein [Vicinamibacterales bacterium]
MVNGSSDNLGTNPAPGRRGLMACALAVALAGLVYANALHNPFIYDDFRLIVENPAIASLGDIRGIVLHDVTRPIVAISYAVDRHFWGPAPFGFRLTNVALHMLNVALFARFTWRAVDDRRRRRGGPCAVLRPGVAAPVAALLFAVHPMMTEAVGYISGRSELLSTTFMLAALLAARAWLLSGRALWICATAVAWIAALGSKETAVLLPAIVFLYDRLLLHEDGGAGRRLRRVHLPLFAAAALMAAARILVFVRIEHARDVTFNPGLLWVEVDAARQYLAMLIAPGGQAIFHAVSPPAFADWRGWLALALVLAVIAMTVAWWRGRRHGLATFGIAWFFLLLVPSAVLVAMDRGELVAEHRVYLASLGFFLAIGVLADLGSTWFSSRSRGAFATALLTVAMAALVLSFGGRTVLRNQLWSNPVLVWLEAAERAPDHWFPALMLGEELHRAGQHDQAIAAYRRAIAARPSEPEPHGKLGLCLAELRDLDGAEAAFAKQRALDAGSAEATNGLATVSLLRGDFRMARQRYLETLAIDPANIAARRGLAAIEEAPGGNPAEALRWCEDIRRLAPGTPGTDECIRRNQDRIAGRTSGSR